MDRDRTQKQGRIAVLADRDGPVPDAPDQHVVFVAGDGAEFRDRLDRVGAALLFWAPVWLPAIVLVQVFFQGLVPTLAERARLDGAEAEVQAWESDLAARAGSVELERRKLADPIYRERVRRTLHDPRQQTLTLERARALAHPEKQLEDL